MEDKRTNTVGQVLYDIRSKLGKTQEQVADNVGISYVSLSRYETGQRMPKMDILARLANYYGVTVDQILNSNAKKEATPPGGLKEKTLRLYDAIPNLTDEETDLLLALVEKIEASHKPV